MLVIGAGLAGAKAVEAARSCGYDGPLVLVGDEGLLPYERPPLSKDVLRGEKPLDSSTVFDAPWYTDHAVELLLDDPVVGLDPGSRTAVLHSGRSLVWDTCVLATGAAPRRLDLPGAALPGVHLLRTRADSAALQSALRAASRVAVLGAGWIGCEVAASARQLGVDVVLVEPAALPLVRVLGETVAGAFRDLHADHGVTLRFGLTPLALQGVSSVEGVALSDGSVEAADLVVVGVGVTPRVELASSAGLHVDDGVVVDEYLQSGTPGVFACGDIASAWHPRFGRHLRVEHWANALNQGAAAGRNATSAPEPYTRLPYFYSDQYDLGLEYVGWADAAACDVAVRGSLQDRQFVAFYHRDGVVDAALAVNTSDVIEDLKALVQAGEPADLARLTDPDQALA
jgi:3-phenylpropionate/trans-cinnamate dioxygenase ferredoxin reductase subunit